MDWAGTSQQAQSGNDGRMAFDVSGDKGSGMLLVEPGQGGLNNAAWAILEIGGKSYVVFGEPPEDLGAEVVPEPEGSGSDDEATETTESAEGTHVPVPKFRWGTRRGSFASFQTTKTTKISLAETTRAP